jgi:hypothetical protein
MARFFSERVRKEKVVTGTGTITSLQTANQLVDGLIINIVREKSFEFTIF